MKIELYGIDVSTSCARTRIVLDHKELDFTYKQPPDGYGSQAYKAIIPSGTVPGLIIDGKAFSDSSAQVELLESLFPAPAMMPKDPYEAAKMRMAAAYHDARLEPAVRALFPFVKQVIRVGDHPNTPIQPSLGNCFRVLQERTDTLASLVRPNPCLLESMLSHCDAAFPTTEPS